MAKDLVFNEDGHVYTIGSMVIPSVTQIISPLYDFGGVNPSVLKYAAERGTEVHFAVEKFIKYGYESRLDSDAQRYFMQFLEWFKGKKFNRLDFACETMVYNKAYNYCGTIDLIWYDEIEKEYTLFDIKTSSATDIKTWSVQLTAYAKACEEYGILIKHINVIQLAEDSFKELTATNELGVFLSCLNIYIYKNK
jgi:hypothetical protein